MKVCDGIVLTISLLAGAACATNDAPPDKPVKTATTRQGLSLDDRISACSNDPRVQAGVTSLDTCVGADLFLRETFNGNGRSCATCHAVDHNLTIDPEFIS